MASLQLENMWQDMVWEVLEDTQLIGRSREQKLNSLTWALNSLAGAPQTHPFLVELESANYSADRKEDHEPGFWAVSCRQQRASFLLFVAISQHLQEVHTGSLPASWIVSLPGGSLCTLISSVLRCFRLGMRGMFYHLSHAARVLWYISCNQTKITLSCQIYQVTASDRFLMPMHHFVPLPSAQTYPVMTCYFLCVVNPLSGLTVTDIFSRF